MPINPCTLTCWHRWTTCSLEKSVWCLSPSLTYKSMAMPFCTLVLVWIDRNFMAPKCTAYWLCWSWPVFRFRSRKWMIGAYSGSTRIELVIDWAIKNNPQCYWCSVTVNSVSITPTPNLLSSGWSTTIRASKPRWVKLFTTKHKRISLMIMTLTEGHQTAYEAFVKFIVHPSEGAFVIEG